MHQGSPINRLEGSGSILYGAALMKLASFVRVLSRTISRISAIVAARTVLCDACQPYSVAVKDKSRSFPGLIGFRVMVRLNAKPSIPEIGTHEPMHLLASIVVSVCSPKRMGDWADGGGAGADGGGGPAESMMGAVDLDAVGVADAYAYCTAVYTFAAVFALV